MTIIRFLLNYLLLFEQYKLVRRISTVLAIRFRLKLILYTKIIVFSFLYNFGYLILLTIENIYKLNYYSYGFFYINSLNSSLELLFAILLAIFLFPLKKYISYYDPLLLNFNFLFLNIKKIKTDRTNISLLTKIVLNNKYQNKHNPLIFIGPFASKQNIFNNLLIGKISNQI